MAERALTSPAVWRLLRRKIGSKTDLEARNQALQILVQFGPGSEYDLRILRDTHRPVEYEEFLRAETFEACVKCLCNMLPAAREAEQLRHHHNSAEADAMWVMRKLFDGVPLRALKAGLVRKWLVNYPFDVRHPEKSVKEVIVKMSRCYEYDDDYERLLGCVLYGLVNHGEGRREMIKYGISDPGWELDDPHNLYGRHWAVRHLYGPSPSEMTLGGGGGGSAFQRYPYNARGTEMEPMEMVPTNFQNFPGNMLPGHPRFDLSPLAGAESSSPRRREESDEERALRSRRREAMVFAEGRGPITREDIIESAFQGDEIMNEEVEEELEQLVVEMGENQGRIRYWLDYLAALRPDGSIARSSV